MDIEELIGSIGASVQNAQNMLNHNAHEMYMDYFQPVKNEAENSADANTDAAAGGEENTDDACEYKPVIKRFNMGDITGGSSIDVPVMSLVNHSSMSLDNVKIKLNVRLSQDRAGLSANVNAPRSADSPEAYQPVHEIEMEFKKADVSEGAARMTDAANKFL